MIDRILPLFKLPHYRTYPDRIDIVSKTIALPWLTQIVLQPRQEIRSADVREQAERRFRHSAKSAPSSNSPPHIFWVSTTLHLAFFAFLMIQVSRTSVTISTHHLYRTHRDCSWAWTGNTIRPHRGTGRGPSPASRASSARWPRGTARSPTDRSPAEIMDLTHLTLSRGYRNPKEWLACESGIANFTPILTTFETVHSRTQ